MCRHAYSYRHDDGENGDKDYQVKQESADSVVVTKRVDKDAQETATSDENKLTVEIGVAL